MSAVNPNYTSAYLDEGIKLVYNFLEIVPYKLIVSGIFDIIEELKSGWGDNQKVASAVVEQTLMLKVRSCESRPAQASFLI